ncbi:hypothetical protein AB0B94_30600 [Micromonospora sp. NPDC048986]|uniref:hypothetical protein n=1 Tax=Micromonospora sp. NPDC048986 TaxID=3155644 RepID=UPI0033F11471
MPANSPNGDKVAGSREPAAPLNLDAEDLLTRVVRNGGIPVDSTPDTMVPVTALTPVNVNADTFDVREWHEEDGDQVTLHREGQHVRRQLVLQQRQVVTGLDGQPLLRPANDQIGYLPVAQVLDGWVRDWIDARQMREHRPTPTVPHLIDWLGHRLDWACDNYEPIGDFTDSIRSVRGAEMAVLGEFDPPAPSCDGVECSRCDRRQLFRAQDGSGDIVCRNENCRKVYRQAEYEEWTRELANRERGRRTPEDIKELLRSRTPAQVM